MVFVRRFEEQAERSFRRGKIGGYLHLYSGQEAVATGFIAAMRQDDILFTGYRDHVHAVLRGTDARAVMAELYGKMTGVCKGKGGSMVRQGSLGLKKGGGHATRERLSSAGASPVRSKPSQQTGSESCVVHRQLWLRSVDSERIGP